MNSNITQELDKLNIDWKRSRPHYAMFVFDGILNPELYNDSSPKILFLLKESNAYFNPIAPLPKDLLGYGPKGNSNTFWRYMKGYEHIIRTTYNNEIFNESDLSYIKEQVNNSIAYVNIKKDCQNKSTSNYNNIMNYAVNDKEYLMKQIDLINPDVIYCGGTIDFYNEIYSDSIMISDKVHESKNRIVIDFLHLAHRRGYKTFKELYELLIKANIQSKVS